MSHKPGCLGNPGDGCDACDGALIDSWQRGDIRPKGVDATDARMALEWLCALLEERYQRELFTDIDLGIAHRAARTVLAEAHGK